MKSIRYDMEMAYGPMIESVCHFCKIDLTTEYQNRNYHIINPEKMLDSDIYHDYDQKLRIRMLLNDLEESKRLYGEKKYPIWL